MNINRMNPMKYAEYIEQSSNHNDRVFRKCNRIVLVRMFQCEYI